MTALAVAGAVILVALVIVLARLPATACCYRHMDVPPQTRGLHLREWHHGWLVVLAFVPWMPIQIVGLVCGADDLIQHIAQFSKTDSRYSVLHQIAHKVGLI